jgi:hypothetical protein
MSVKRVAAALEQAACLRAWSDVAQRMAGLMLEAAGERDTLERRPEQAFA